MVHNFISFWPILTGIIISRLCTTVYKRCDCSAAIKRWEQEHIEDALEYSVHVKVCNYQTLIYFITIVMGWAVNTDIKRLNAYQEENYKIIENPKKHDAFCKARHFWYNLQCLIRAGWSKTYCIASSCWWGVQWHNLCAQPSKTIFHKMLWPKRDTFYSGTEMRYSKSFLVIWIWVWKQHSDHCSFLHNVAPKFVISL